MGLWNFVKNAGKSLIGSAEASEAPPEDALRKEVEDLGLNADGLEISVDGDKVTVSGNAVDQETREKVILAVGNVEGVASVEDNAKSGDGADPAGFHTVKKGESLWKNRRRASGKWVEVYGNLRGQPPDAERSGQDLSWPDVANSRLQGLNSADPDTKTSAG